MAARAHLLRYYFIRAFCRESFATPSPYCSRLESIFCDGCGSWFSLPQYVEA